MNYLLFALLALMFIAYVYMKRSNKKKGRKKEQQNEQQIKFLQDEIAKLKGNQS